MENDKDKKNYDKTRTARGQKFTEGIKNAGGATFSVRLLTAEETTQVDELISAGEGLNRNDLIRKLIARRYAEIKNK